MDFLLSDYFFLSFISIGLFCNLLVPTRPHNSTTNWCHKKKTFTPTSAVTTHQVIVVIRQLRVEQRVVIHHQGSHTTLTDTKTEATSHLANGSDHPLSCLSHPHHVFPKSRVIRLSVDIRRIERVLAEHWRS